jgi:predicted nucleic acid-binding protein
MNVLVDTSAWIEFLRRTDTAAGRAVATAVRNETAATTDVVIMEVLAGTTDPDRVISWERALDRAKFLAQVPRDDAETAAALYRQCRAAGESPRQLTDCLVAAVALRNDVSVLHCDRDFEVLGRHTALRETRI